MVGCEGRRSEFWWGSGLGLLVFGQRPEAPKRTPRGAETVQSAPPSTTEPQPASSPPGAPTPPPPNPLPKNTRGYVLAETVDGERRYSIDGVRIDPRPLAEILEAMKRARAEKNWPEFVRGIVQLGMLNTAEGDSHLVAILADSSLRLKGPWAGTQFYEALRDSRVEGIAEAARARALMELDKKPRSNRAGVGYLGLVALHGGGPEHAWLESLTTDGAGIVRADRAFAKGAANPAAAERMRRRYIDKGIQPAGEWLMFARENPAVAFDTAAELIRRNPTSVDGYRMLGQAATPDTLARAGEILGNLPNDDARLQGIRAVQLMGTRKLDISGFDELLNTPRVVLEDVLSERRTPTEGTPAISALLYCSCARTEANMAALRRTAEIGKPTIAQAA